MTGAVLTAVTGSRATVTLENAGKLNAMSLGMWAELAASVARSGIGAARSHKRQIRRLMTDPSPVGRDERLQHYAFAETAEYRDGIRRFLARTEA